MIELGLATPLPRLHDTRAYGASEEASPFARGPKERPIRFVVDDAQLASSPACATILTFQHHQLAEIITTAAMSDLPRLTVRPPVREHDFMLYRIERPDGWTDSQIWTASRWLDMAKAHHTAHGGDLADIEHRVLVARAASERAEGLVLGGPRLDPRITERSNPLTPTQGAALLGLFLRSRDDDVVDVQPRTSLSMSIPTQRFVVTRYVLLEGWRWYSACVHSSVERLTALGSGVQVRFERALRARDETMVECLRRETGKRAVEREILYHFDAMLIWLGGALDTTALVANAALEWPGSSRSCDPGVHICRSVP